MTHHAWSQIARSVFVDRDTNEVAVIPVDGVTVRTDQPPPADGPHINVPITLEILSLWWEDDRVTKDLETRVRIIYRGRQLEQLPIRVSMVATQLIRSRVRLEGIPYGGPGTHIYALDIRENGEWRMVAELPLVVSDGFQAMPGTIPPQNAG